ncbi:Sulfur carrier protein adenylyltransferase ThiF [Lunatimonas lonarensis]|uniref:Molybdopterin-synthase adenylyltransferase n=1 Tax=Lunatimonas lonarensis TaxID=1232681 RepID=R7ZVV4_9BACT|nr:molybdopterin-synthase adenylyltransferase MoeB [Lunatimonas lonarensis]EON78280.1 Sulfur carrier protein adenylyltransferase ThiF [Lunatimonas lonarensis]
MATVLVPTPLRKFTEGSSSVKVEGQSIEELLGNLIVKFPGLKNYLNTSEGKIPSFINIFVDSDDIRNLEGGNTAIKEGSIISIVPAIAGGGLDDISFSREELARYNRHIIIPEFGLEGQKKLKNSKVLVIGSGGLGSPLLLYLAAAGVGHIGIVDFDTVDDSNLHRQVLFGVSEVGKPKVEAARERLLGINPYIEIKTFNEAFSSKNAMDIIRDYDVVADGTDNFPTRYLVNDACVLSGKTNVYASIFQFEGQVTVFNYTDRYGTVGPNYRDLYLTPPPAGLVPNCAEGGVLGVLPGIIGSLQALEVIKVITGVGEPLSGKLFTFDALSFRANTFNIKRNDANPLNGSNPSQFTLIDYEQFCGMKVVENKIKEIDVEDFFDWRNTGVDFQLIDVREPHEYEEENMGGELIPLGSILENAHKIAKEKRVLVHCKMGGRSAKAIRQLEDKFGFTNLYNLKGGIEDFLQYEEGY